VVVAAVADVAVRTHEVVRGLLDVEPGERLAADVVEDVRSRFAGETVRRDEAGVAPAQAGELIVVPTFRGSAEQEVVRRCGEYVLQPTLARFLDNVSIGKPISGPRPAAERRRPLVDGWTVSVVDAQLGEGAEADGTQSGDAQDDRHEPWRDLGSDQARYWPVGGRDRGGTVGEAEHEAADWQALGLVGVEQRFVGHATVDQGELPAEVPGVLDAGIHALGAGRAVHVGGIAGKKDAAGAVADGLPVMEPEVRKPHGVAQAQRATGKCVRNRLQVDE